MTIVQLSHTPQELIAEAQRRTVIHDITDSAIVERLQRLVASLNTEARLNANGAAAMEKHLLRVLTNRLWMLRDFRDHPEIAEQPIRPPLIMTGAPRTGSTKLHKMLAAGGDFLWLPFWQGYSLALRSGDRNKSPDARIRDAEEHVRWFNEQSPEARLTHEFSTFEPEEENLVLEHCLNPPYIAPFVMTPSYIEWAMSLGLREDFEFLRRSLQYLQWQFHDGDPRPWLLKNPGYPAFEGLLAEVFPGARFVTTNRDPADVLSSGASLLACFHRIYSDDERRKLFGPVLAEGLSTALNAHIALRDANPALPILDIGYSETVRSAEQAVRKIYAHMDLTISDAAAERMRDWEEKNNQHKHGRHRHSLEDGGLTPEMVTEKFKPYIARFGALF